MRVTMFMLVDGMESTLLCHHEFNRRMNANPARTSSSKSKPKVENGEETFVSGFGLTTDSTIYWNNGTSTNGGSTRR